jgi:hypothetical protein
MMEKLTIHRGVEILMQTLNSFRRIGEKGTIISTQRGSTYENKRMAKINFHMSMNHKDRSLFHAYRDIDEACHTLPEICSQRCKNVL